MFGLHFCIAFLTDLLMHNNISIPIVRVLYNKNPKCCVFFRFSGLDIQHNVLFLNLTIGL